MHGSGAACLLVLLPFFAQAQVAVPPVTPAEQTQQGDAKTGVLEQHALEASDLESFFDGIVPLQLERSDVAGASVLVMQNGQVLLQKGYGYADLKPGNRSILRPPSSGWHRFPSYLPGLP